MNDLTYVTGNYGKFISVKGHFEEHKINISYYHCDLPEPSIDDIEVVSKEKAKEAYDIIKKPVFVADSGFYIEDYPNHPGYPGALVKRSGVSSNIEALLHTMKNVSNRNCSCEGSIVQYRGMSGPGSGRG